MRLEAAARAVTFPAQDAFEVATALAAALEAAQIPYAVGGAIAYVVWGDQVGTHDVNI